MSKKTFRLPKKFTEEWLQNLRSKDYKQTKSYLYNENQKGYCCLGVACHMSGISPEELSAKDFIIHDFDNIPEELKGAELNSLPYILAALNDGVTQGDYIELNIKHPNLKFNKEISKVKEKTQYTFEEIADFIELNVKTYDTK